MTSRVDIIGQNGNDGLPYCTGTCRTNSEHLERHAQGLGCMGDQFTKHDQGKTQYNLIPPQVLKLLADQLTFGAQKYRPDNWKKGDKERYYDALMRHMQAMRMGERHDDEGRLHSQAMICNAMFLVWMDLQEAGEL